mmetsp:Transcript_151925/g.487608  ORF Transcript_151925/g.487608 Transcript_151925/m.487608 type:complete len:218 (+) Transcript_151925:185-838(+)
MAFWYTSSFGFSCNASILLKPSACSTSVANALSAAPCSTCRALPTFSTFSRASSATPMTFASVTVSRSRRGLRQPLSTRYSICCGEPPEVALAMTQAASFLISNSPVCSRCITGGIKPLAMTSWICSRLPAVMLEMAQQLSFRMAFFVWPSSRCRADSAPLCTITCVWWSSPVTMLPTALRAGVCTSGELCNNKSTSRLQTPARMTAVIRSLGPSDR